MYVFKSKHYVNKHLSDSPAKKDFYVPIVLKLCESVSSLFLAYQLPFIKHLLSG